ncbi:MAG: MFS transporter [Pontiellaceae bacterium]|nr:MFS transporter [Pontiellaceae bacterium]
MKVKTLPILLAFLVMGVADAMGPMSNAVQDNYELSAVMATLLSFFVFIAFAAFSVPGGLLAARIGKKNLLLLGLGLNAVAMLIPCLIEPGFALLLGCIFVLGIGTTLLQVAGNPLMRDVSAEGNYGRNLSLAQGFKGIGSTLSSWIVGGTALAGVAVLAKMGWRGVFPIFFILMAGAFVLVLFLKIDEAKADVPPSIGSSLGLLKKPVFALAVLGIFLYVGAEASMGRFLLPQMRAAFHVKYNVTAPVKDIDDALDAATKVEAAKSADEGTAMDAAELATAQADLAKVAPDELERAKQALSKASKFGPALFFLLLTIGRLLGGVVLNVMSPRNFFRLSAALGLAGAALLIFGNTALSIVGVVLGGLGFANIWPMLFSITVEEDPDRGSELSGLMCMAISGGAIVPLVMGKLVDVGLNSKSFLVPVACFAFLLVLSLKGPSKSAEPAA